MDKNQNQSNQQTGEGRTSGINQPDLNKKTSSDISNVDRQEGEMNHGELGSDLKIKPDGELDTDE